jgi:hypothetical protein
MIIANPSSHCIWKEPFHAPAMEAESDLHLIGQQLIND